MAGIRQTVHAGTTVLIFVNGQKVGRATNLTPSERFNQESVYELGEIKPAENVPLRYQGSFTLTRFKVIKASLKQLKIVPNANNVLKQELLEFKIMDKITGQPLASFVGCSVEDFRETITANAIIGEDATFFFLERVDYDENGQPIQ